MAFDPLSAALSIGESIIKRVWPDPEQQDKARLAMMQLQQSGELQSMVSAAGIIQAEAQSEHWLTASWRPIVMLVLTGCVVAYWLGFTAPNLPELAVIELLSIVKVGLGGYVIGRSAEKAAKAWKGKE